MQVQNEVMPTSEERLQGMMAPGPEGPIYMVNDNYFRKSDAASDPVIPC